MHILDLAHLVERIEFARRERERESYVTSTLVCYVGSFCPFRLAVHGLG